MHTGPAERRRETGADSARALLLTVLGEFVLPRGAPVWTGVLVAALDEIGGIEEKAAPGRGAHRRGGDLVRAERAGRRVRWHLTPTGTRLLTDGTERIYGFGRRVAEWDGRWLVLAVSVPETRRQLRHRLRTRLTWAGLGSPLPGLWITPDTGKEQEVAAVVAELAVEAFTVTGPSGVVGDPARVVADAWALADVEQRYREFLGHPVPAVDSSAEAFREQVRLVQRWRRFPFLDPALPAELLPASWPGAAAVELFSRWHAAWHEPAQAHWEQLCGESGARS